MTERPARRLLAVSAAVSVAAGVFVLENAHSTGRGRDDLSERDLRRVAAVTAPATDFSKAEQYEAMSGGAATSLAAIDINSFSHFSENITFAEEETFKLGNALFQKLWVSSPSSTQASDGLGPLYNARSCQTCII